jgi:L-lysine 2,3-aminomutase
MDNLHGHISGLAVPQFVIDAPGGGGNSIAAGICFSSR